MITVAEMLRTVRARTSDGSLGHLCDRYDIDLVVLHGSARTDPGTARDLDLAYLPAQGSPPAELAVMDALMDLVPGDPLDVMPLHRADPVAAWAALGRGEPLVERRPGLFAEERIRAWGEFRDTQKFRDLALTLVGS